MDQRLRQLCDRLRAMSSEDAAIWLMQTYNVGEPSYGEAFLLLPHRSWKRADQLSLARYYLERMPFASERPYLAFLSFMSIRNFVRVLRERLPSISADRLSLLHYHLYPRLKQYAITGSDVRECENLLADIQRSMNVA